MAVVTWVKFSDDTPRTTEDLNDAEFRLWFDFHCHSMTQLSDGILTRRDVVWVLNDRPESLFDALVTAGRIEPATVSTWMIVDYKKTQSSSEEIEAGRKRANVRKERSRGHLSGNHALCRPKFCELIRNGWTPDDGLVLPEEAKAWTASHVTPPSDRTPPEAKRTEVTLGTKGAKRSAAASAGATASAAQRKINLPSGTTVGISAIEFSPDHSEIKIEGKSHIGLRIASKNWASQIAEEEGDGCDLCSATLTKGAGQNKSTLTLVIPTISVSSELIDEIVGMCKESQL